MPASTSADTSRAASLAEEAAQAIQETTLTICWEQWRSLGAFAGASGPRRAQAIVDPEALVLLSLLLREEERRLDDFLGWWVNTGGALLSVQRMHNLARRLPDQTSTRLGTFARLAVKAGDKRWRRYADKGEEVPRLSPREGKGAEQPALDAPPALLLRLRAGFGVGAKADLLAFLLGVEGTYVTAREAAEAIGYTEMAVRTAAQEMVLARFVREDADERPARYAVDPEPWVGLLGLTATSSGEGTKDQWPTWQYWAEVFAFFAGVLQWAQEGRRASWSAYVWSSRARDLAVDHAWVFKTTVVERSRMNGRPGIAYLEAFASWIRDISEWSYDHL